MGDPDGDRWYCALHDMNSQFTVQPEIGCEQFALNPLSDPKVVTKARWIRSNGLPVVGYTDRPDKWPPALSAAQIRAAYEQNKTPQTRQLAWEIARLGAIIDQTIAALNVISGYQMTEYPRRSLLRLLELLQIDRGPHQ